MQIKGKITSWNDSKGFGFITPLTGGDHIFVHISAFNSRKRRPTVNQRVTYTLSTDKKGRACAVKVARSGEQTLKKPTTASQKSFVVTALFLIIIGASVLLGKLPVLILLLYILMSPLTFIVYAVDKSAAMKGAWRIPESTLHLLSVGGGWPGAMIAQQLLRHKTKKQSFRIIFWITVIVNCGVLIWWHSPDGANMLQAIIKNSV
jgi:uncharacterized membrane protein YsdA (DUF1294 family)/cold shock CspA family protein